MLEDLVCPHTITYPKQTTGLQKFIITHYIKFCFLHFTGFSVTFYWVFNGTSWPSDLSHWEAVIYSYSLRKTTTVITHKGTLHQKGIGRYLSRTPGDLELDPKWQTYNTNYTQCVHNSHTFNPTQWLDLLTLEKFYAEINYSTILWSNFSLLGFFMEINM